MSKAKSTSGIEVRHRKACVKPRADGKCCAASFQAQAYDKRAGRTIKKSFPTRTAAKLWRADVQKAIRDGELVTPTTRTVKDALDNLIAAMKDGTALDRSGRHYRPATVRSYAEAANKYLKPALGRLRLSEVRRADIQRLVDRMHADGLAGSTIRNKLDPLRVVYRRAVQDHEITATRRPSSGCPPSWSSRGVASITIAPRNCSRRYQTVSGHCGRPRSTQGSASANCARSDGGASTLIAASYASPRAGMTSRANRRPRPPAGARTVPLVGLLRTELARHQLATRRRGDDLVFGRTHADAFVRLTVRSRANRAWHAAELEPLSAHEARHTCASYLAAAGLTPKEAQTAMGHADIRTTLNIYAKAVPGWETGAAAKLDAYLGDAACI